MTCIGRRRAARLGAALAHNPRKGTLMEALHPDVSEVVLSEQDIKDIVARMGKEITADYKDKNPLVVAVLKGAVVFTADIMRAIDCPIAIDFMAVSSYGDGVKSSGVVRIVKDLDTKIEGRDVLIVEDILDSGLTLTYLLKNLASRNPASLTVATLLRKKTKVQADVDCAYVGFECPDQFIVGYGLDYAERYRNLPYIGVLKPEVYE